MTAKEVADYLEVSRITLRRWENRGWLKPIRVGNLGWKRYLTVMIERMKPIIEDNKGKHWYKNWVQYR